MSFYQTAFCCFDDLEKGAKYVVGFTAVTSIVNLIINISILVNVHWFYNNLEPLEEWTWLPPGTLAFLYIELIFNLIFLFLAYVLHSGIKENELRNKRYCCLGWGIGVMVARGYEIFLMIYFLVWIGSYRISDFVFIYTEGLFIVAYWVIDTLILVLAVVLVNYYYAEQYYLRRGKMKRINFVAAMRKIRNKAITRIVKHSGPQTFAQMGMLQSRGPSVASTLQPGKSRTQSTATYMSVPSGPRTASMPGGPPAGGPPPGGPRGPPPGQRFPPPRDTSTMVGPPGQRPMGPRPMGPPGGPYQRGPAPGPGGPYPPRGPPPGMMAGPPPGSRMRQPYFPGARPSQGQ